MLSKLVGTLFVLVLVVGVPIVSILTARRSDIRLVPRQALYLSAVISQWVLAIAGAVVVAIVSSFSTSGFRVVPVAVFLRWTASLTLIALAATALSLLLERISWWPQESELIHLLLPQTRAEKVWAVGILAPTAALCEEFLYRGYLLAQLTSWLESAPWALVVSSVAFGLAHAYQGMGGMTRTALLGALLAYPVLRLGSLYPSIAAHFVVDALALAWLGPRYVRRELPQ